MSRDHLGLYPQRPGGRAPPKLVAWPAEAGNEEKATHRKQLYSPQLSEQLRRPPSNGGRLLTQILVIHPEAFPEHLRICDTEISIGCCGLHAQKEGQANALVKHRRKSKSKKNKKIKF